VLFETSERSWHGFPRIAVPEDRRTEISRRSIAVYFYTEERPADEVRPEHATVYVPRHLPEHVRPGHTLSESDVAILRDLLARRDMHLRFLYEREYEHSSALRIIQDSQAYQLAWKMIAAVRKIKAWVGGPSRPATCPVTRRATGEDTSGYNQNRYASMRSSVFLAGCRAGCPGGCGAGAANCYSAEHCLHPG
jgi:hypothetical protein